MRKRTLLVIAMLLVAVQSHAAETVGAPAKQTPRKAKPNFLVIVADDMGFSDPGCYGGEVETPNLDRLAAGGLRFTNMYSTARCWPSRTCLLTGYYPQQVRMDPPRGKVPKWTRVIPHYIEPLGYRTYHSGKWHLMGANMPIADGGFDRSYRIDDHDRFFAPKRAVLDDKPLPPVPDGTDFYLTTQIAQYGIDFLKQHADEHADKPFLLYLAFTSPHFPLQAKPEDIARYRDRYREGWDSIREKRYRRMLKEGLINCDLSPRDERTIPDYNLSEADLKRRIGPGEAGHAVAWDSLTDAQKDFQATKMAIHAAMVDRMDQEIGRVLEQLKAMKAFDDTVIFFVSDNGASAEQIIRGDGNDPEAAPGSAKSYLCLGPGWSTASNTPFRLHKSWVHEGGIASPMIVHWTQGIADRGALRHTQGHFVDVIPTILSLAGATPKAEWNGLQPPPLPGKSLVPALHKDIPVEREYIYWHHQNNRAIRVGDWKLVSAYVGKDFGPWELYKIDKDRAESKDLAAEYPEKVAELSKLWEQREAEFVEQAGPAEAEKADAKKPAKGKSP